MTFKSDLELAKNAAKEGVRVIKKFKKKGIQISQKGFHDLVTDADLAAEKAILAIIQESCPD
ncbi:MAG: inositol monophosphatase, partial [Candidatus Paceibacterota bacterium]